MSYHVRKGDYMELEATAKIVKKLEAPGITYYSNFFSLDGGEGSGKSTVLDLVGKRLAADGIKTICTREPGGTGSAKAEAIRKLLYKDGMNDIAPLTAAFLYAAARAQHVQEIILPHLQDGYVVLTDRYVDSSLVYQGMVENNLEQVTVINQMAIMNTMPATTFLFDVPPEIGIKRVFANQHKETNYIDHKDMEFHRAVYQDYQILSRIFAKRYVVIDATAQVDAVAEQVYQVVKERLAKQRSR